MQVFIFKRYHQIDFSDGSNVSELDGPVVKTSPSNPGVLVRSLVGEPRSHMPLGKTENRNSTVTNSIKTFKMVHIKKKKSLREIYNNALNFEASPE